ncbi:hypothetical protein F7734_54585 [Scytonema sp. UIC 10036]|uniref:hypothetical protein n=1 Tax=Scytonema sp. UIC 10036 TaxID=2304196 RepID=UPI0012DAC224|nr:hypothetical protein [Scytonema sp. UIC 10036]MUH00827.1 hypothetical protein [Scytonema sp. UIC 10036]
MGINRGSDAQLLSDKTDDSRPDTRHNRVNTIAKSIDITWLTRPGHFPIGGWLTSGTFGTIAQNLR